jgi:hypothetical protein
MSLEVDQAQQPFSFSLGNLVMNSSFHLLDFAFQLGENYL